MRPRRFRFVFLPRGATRVLTAAALGGVAFLAPSGPRPAPAAPPAETAPPTRPADGPRPGDLLRDLSSDDWRMRQRAERELVGMGDAAGPLIDELLRTAGGAEARARLEGARARIAENRVAGPSMVTLRLTDASPAELFAELSRQARAELKLYPSNLFEHGRWPRVSIDVKGKPFWEVMRELGPRLGVRVGGHTGELRLMSAGGGAGPAGDFLASPFAHVSGPVLFVPGQLTRTQVVDLTGPPAHSGAFQLSMTAVAEPKLVVLQADGAVRLDEAVDDRGNSLLAEGVAPPAGPLNTGGRVFPITCRLKYPDRNPGRTIARLRGTMRFVIQTKSERLEIADVLASKEVHWTAGDARVVVHGMTRGPDGYELQLGIGSAQPAPVGAGRGAGWQLHQSMQNRLRLLDANDQPVERRGYSSRNADDRTEFTLQFSEATHPHGRRAAEPLKLVWEVPTETREVAVPFEFKDLPMPRP